MIPKKIWSAWFGKEMSPVVVKCLESQVKFADDNEYEYKWFHEDSFLFDSTIPEYLKEAIKNEKWVKATDYLRAWVLSTQGGIFMDADMEVLPGKTFDDLLHAQMFAGREENGFVGYSLVGSEPHHPLWDEYLKQVNEKFTPLDGKNFESSMEIFTHLAYSGRHGEVTLLDPDFFFPYNHQTGIIGVTKNTKTFHHFMKTWTDISPDLLPTVTIVIPQLGREEGLSRCLESIDRMYYPKHLVEVIVEEGPDTVPVKVERAYGASRGSVVVYGANDIEFAPECLYNAVQASKHHGLVAFNEGDVLPDEGNICTHFLIKKDLVPKLEKGQVFSTDFHHVGADNWLWAQAKRLGEAYWCKEAIIKHHHFSKGSEYDEVYKKGWSKAEQDREILKKKLELIG